MAEKLSTGIAIDECVLMALSAWADEEFRSRNSLIEMILTRAVEHRRKRHNDGIAELDVPIPALLETN